jgi:hypothetical protein
MSRFSILSVMAVGVLLFSFFSVVDAQDDTSRVEFGAGGGSAGGFAPAINAQCGTAAREYNLRDANFQGAFCAQGIMDETLLFPAVGTTTTWICTGFNNGDFATCSASHLTYNSIFTSGTSTQVEPIPLYVETPPQKLSFFQLLIINLRTYFTSLLKK